MSKSLEHLRKQKRRQRLTALRSLLGFERVIPSVHDVDFQHPGLDLENKEWGQILTAALEKLPENQKIAFTLHKIEQMSYQEIGEVMQTSLSAIESLMHRARQNLRRHLEKYYTNE